MDNLKQKTINALIWRGMESFGQQGITFIIQIVLARLLLPEQFGLIAMLTIFIALAQAFIDSGFGQALIQKKDATHVDECSIFYFNILVSFLAAGLLCLAAPWIADFYDQPLLTPLIRVLSLNLIINAFGLVHTTLLTKHIDFKTQMKVRMIATFLSGTIGVTMAFKGFGVWSLVAQYLGSSLFHTVLLWFFNTWRPSLVFSSKAMRIMFGFGSRLLVSGLIGTCFQNIYLVIIGKLFSPATLGFYSRAKKIQQLPSASIATTISRVSFPVFSTIQGNPARLKRGMRKALTTMGFMNFPPMIGLAVVGKPLVLVLLTEKWAPCIPYLQLLCVVGLFWPLHVINLNVLKAQGRSDLFLRLEVLKKILVVISIAVTYRWGIMAMIYGQIVVSFLSYFLNSYYTGRLINYPFKEQIRDLLPYLGITMVMAIGVYSVQWFPFPNNLTLLACQVFVGISIYAAIGWALRMPAFVEIVDVLKSKLKLCKTQP